MNNSLSHITGNKSLLPELKNITLKDYITENYTVPAFLMGDWNNPIPKISLVKSAIEGLEGFE